jgi:hypothetical protein
VSRDGIILAIDPGPEQSAWLCLLNGQPAQWGIYDNARMLTEILVRPRPHATLAIEMIASYGMPVGAETFETCLWIGRFQQRWLDTAKTPALSPVRLVYRRDVRMHLCDDGRKAKDAHVRQALIDRYGPGKAKAIGLKKTPGPLYGISSHVWSALAVAVTVADNEDAAPFQEPRQ